MASSQGEPTNAPELPFFGEVAGKTFDDPAGIPSLEVLHADMRRIVAFVEAATGLVSRWSGDVFISDETDTNGDPKFTGRKEPNCPSTMHRVVLGHKERYLTSLHEALHSVSVGMPMGEGFNYWRSYEEGVVTAVSEMLMESFSHHLNVSQFTFINAYPKLTRFLEVFRAETGLSKETFYLTLLQMPVRSRRTGIKEMIAQQRAQSISDVERDDALREALEIFRTFLW